MKSDIKKTAEKKKSSRVSSPKFMLIADCVCLVSGFIILKFCPENYISTIIIILLIDFASLMTFPSVFNDVKNYFDGKPVFSHSTLGKSFVGIIGLPILTVCSLFVAIKLVLSPNRYIETLSIGSTKSTATLFIKNSGNVSVFTQTSKENLVTKFSGKTKFHCKEILQSDIVFAFYDDITKRVDIYRLDTQKEKIKINQDFPFGNEFAPQNITITRFGKSYYKINVIPVL